MQNGWIYATLHKIEKESCYGIISTATVDECFCGHKLDIQSRYNNNNNNNNKAVVNITLCPRCAICCDCIRDDKVKYRMELLVNTLKMFIICCSAVSTRLLPTPRAIITHYVKTWRHQQNRKYITYWLSSENDWATAIGDMYREFREVWKNFGSCLWDMRVDRQTYRYAHRNTSHRTVGEVIRSDQSNLAKQAASPPHTDCSVIFAGCAGVNRHLMLASLGLK